MDDTAFDQFTRLTATSRRAMLRTVASAGVSTIGFVALRGPDAAAAKKRGGKSHNGKHQRCKPKPDGSQCKSSKDCCSKQTKHVCRTAPADLGMQKVCCGGKGASCGKPGNFCCLGLSCSSINQRCERAA